MIKKKVVYMDLKLYKQISKLRGIEFMKWDEKHRSIISDYDQILIYEPKRWK